MTSNYSFGIPRGGFVPTGALDSILPYLTYGPNTALQLTQLQNQRDIADRQAWASVFGDQIRAGATVQAAAAAANAQVQAQQIQSGAMLQATQATIQGDLEKARMGDIAAAQRLKATLGLQAGTTNAGTAMQLAQMAGSGQLRDAIANRLALRGFGAMPGIGSALNGVQDRIWVNAPNVEMPPMYNTPSVGGLSGGGGGAAAGGGTQGGGFGYSGGGFSMPQGGGNIADTFNGIYRGIQPSLQFGNVFGFGGGPSGSAPATPSSSSAPAPTAADPPWYKALFQGVLERDRTGLLTASHGGTFGSGAAVLVGDDPSGMPTGHEEVVRARPGGFEVIPLAGRAATGGTFGTSEPYPGYDSSKEYALLRQQALASRPTPQSYLDPQYSAANIGNYSAAAGSSYDPGMSASEFQAARTGIAQNGSDYAKKVFGALGGPGLTGGGSKPLGPLPPQPIGSGGGTLPPQPIGPTGPGGMLPLFDVNQIPAFQMLRSGQVWPSFGMGPQSFSEPGLGISSLPGPEASASTFRKMTPYDQEDALQGWEFLGVPRAVSTNKIQAVTPGFRFQPRRAFGY